MREHLLQVLAPRLSDMLSWSRTYETLTTPAAGSISCLRWWYPYEEYAVLSEVDLHHLLPR